MANLFRSLLLVVAVAAVAGGATYAYFTDSETVENNTFAAGSLDLNLGEGNPIPFSLTNIAPGDSGNGNATLTATIGNVDGELDVALTNYLEAENTCLEPEVEAGDPCDAGDLGLSLQFAIFIDKNQDGTYNQGDGDIELEYSGNTNTTPGLQFANAQSFIGDEWDDVLTMVSGDQVDLVIQWNFPHNAYVKPDAIYMTDSLSFDVETSLEQVGGTGGVAN